MAEVAQAGPEDARAAVGVAHRAFEEGPWPRMSATERGRVLLTAATLVRERSEDLAVTEARNGGKPITAARGEIDLVVNTLEYWGGAANKIFGESIPVQDPGIDVTLREPVGVCALITPWNFPAVIATWKIGPRAGVRKHDRGEAGHLHPAVGPGAGQDPGRGGTPTRGRLGLARAGVDDRHGADHRPPRVQDQASPARPRSAPRSWPSAPRTSPGSRWSSGASRPT